MNRQSGFSLVEVLVVVGMVAAVTLSIGALRGMRPPQTRVAALGLQAALSEARSLAMSNGGATRSGAMLSVVPAGGESVVSVYDSRPIAGEHPPAPDPAFPPIQYPVVMSIVGKATGEPFAVFVTSSGYASVAENYAYDPQRPLLLTADPGCDERNGVAISVNDGARTETHPLTCREAQYDASSAPTPSP